MAVKDQLARRGLTVPMIIIATIGALLAASLIVFLAARRATDSNSALPVDDLVSAEVDPTEVDLASQATVGDAAPVVVLEGIGNSNIDLKKSFTKPTLINFWASSCAPCVKEMPLIDEVFSQYDNEVSVIGINVAEAENPALEMIESTAVTYPNGRDPSGSIFTVYSGTVLPQSVMVDANGIVTAIHTGKFDTKQDIVTLIETAR